MAKLADFFIGILIKYVLKYLETTLPKVIQEWKNKKERELAQAEAKKKLDSVNNDPNASAEQKAKAYEDFINSGNQYFINWLCG